MFMDSALWRYLFQCRIDMIIWNMSRILDEIFSSEDACTRKPAPKKKLTPTSVKVCYYLYSRSERGHVLVYISVCPFVCHTFFRPIFLDSYKLQVLDIWYHDYTLYHIFNCRLSDFLVCWTCFLINIMHI